MIRRAARGLTLMVLVVAIAAALTIQWTGPAFWLALSAACVAALTVLATRWIVRLAGTPERVCRGCGCTDSRACPAGCWWIDLDPTGEHGGPLCSRCARQKLLDNPRPCVLAICDRRATEVLHAGTAAALFVCGLHVGDVHQWVGGGMAS